MAEPVLERIPRPAFSIDGLLGERIAATQRNWLLPMPAANPALLQMFSDRDRPRGARPPSEGLLPWSGEFAGKYLIAGAQFVRLTGDPALRAHFDRFVRDLIDSQGSDGYLGPFESRARMIGKPESKVWSNFFPAGDRPTEWNGWFAVGDNVFPQGAAVTTLSTRPGGTSLYVLGFDRKVWTNFFPAADEARWNGWFPLGDNVFPEGSRVTALSTRENGTSLYALGLDRKVWTNFFPAADGSARWNGWLPQGDNVFPEGSTVTALSTVPGGTSLYVVGLDGKVWTNFFPAADGSARWSGWFPLGDNVFPAPSTVTALSTREHATSLYVLGLDRKVWTNFFPAADGSARWNGWFALGDNVFPVASTVTALSTRENGTSLYVLGLDRKVWTNFFPAADGSSRWNGWFALGDNVFPERSSVTALSTRPGGTSLYVVGLEWKVWTNFFPAADGSFRWSGWFALGHPVFPEGATVSALSTTRGVTSLYVAGVGRALWDLWGQYHCMLGLYYWYRATGDQDALGACRRAADLFCAFFLDAGRPVGYAGEPAQNQSCVHLFTLLFQETGVGRYLDMARAIPLADRYVSSHSHGEPFYAGPEPRWEGLAGVQGIAELFFITGQQAYRQAFEQIWWSIAEADRHNSGGFGAGEEATGNPYSPLPIETCATVGWMALTVDMLRMSGDSRAADELELSTWNATLGSQDPSGASWTYDTPMGGVPVDGMNPMLLPAPLNRAPRFFGERRPTTFDLEWQARDGSPDLSCCSANGARGLGVLSDWAIMVSKAPLAAGIAINYYGRSTLSAPAPSGRDVRVTQDTDYPATGFISLTIAPAATEAFTIHLRIPSWSRSTQVLVNGQSPLVPVRRSRYLALSQEWHAGDTIELVLDMSPWTWVGEGKPARARRDGSAIGRMSVYHGPVLMAHDPRFDAAARPIPTIDLRRPPRRLERRGHAALLLEYASSEGDAVTLCDFASAGATGSRDGSFPTRSIVTALSSRPGGESVYVCGLDGRVWTNLLPAVDGSARWNGWFALGDNVFPAGSTVTALSARENGTSLYVLGLDRKVWTNFFPAADGSARWNGWFALGDNVFPVASTVTALSTRENGTSLYVLGLDRKVWTNFFPAADGSSRWNGWFALADNVFPEGSTVTALSTVPGGTSLYVVGLDGKVWTNFFPSADGSPRWNGWFPLADNVFPARSTVTALSTVPGGTSLYVLGLDRKVWTNSFPAADGSARWNGWFALADNVFPEGSTVTALSTVPGGTSLYVVGLDQKVWANFFPAADGVARWEGWFPLGDRKFPERSTVSALSTRRGKTSLYVAVFDGNVWTNFFPAPDRPLEWDGWWFLAFPAYISWLPAPAGLRAAPFTRDNPLRASQIG